MRKMSVLVFCLCCSAFSGRAQNLNLNDYLRQARQAYQAKDYSAYFTAMQAVVQLRPDNPNLKYNFAGANALAGKNDEALRLLSQLAEMGLVYDAAADEDFTSIKALEAYKNILKKFDQNKTPNGFSTVAFKLPEKDLITESVAYDPKTETFYVSSVHKRKIVSRNKKGEIWDFATRQDGLWAAMGMKVDANRRVLWVCSAAVPEMQEYQKAEDGRSGVFSFDLKTGKSIKQYLLANDAQPHVLGDLTLSAKGEVYISDSQTPALYRISPEKNELELFLTSDLLRSPQGLALSDDEKFLFVADYSAGLFVVELATKMISKISTAENVAFTTVDGMYFYKNSLLAIQNGFNPQRVVRFFLNKTFDRIEGYETIAANHPDFNEPTLGVLVKNNFYFVANSQWGSFNKDKTIFSLDKLQEPIILQTKLEKK